MGNFAHVLERRSKMTYEEFRWEEFARFTYTYGEVERVVRLESDRRGGWRVCVLNPQTQGWSYLTTDRERIRGISLHPR